MKILEISPRHTDYFIRERGYQWAISGRHLVKGKKQIHFDYKVNRYVLNQYDSCGCIVRRRIITEVTEG